MNRKHILSLIPCLAIATLPVGLNATESIQINKPSIRTAIAGSQKPATQEEKVSYILGMNIGNQFKANQVPLNREFFDAGMKASINGSKPALSAAEIQQTMAAFQADMQAKQAGAEQQQQASLKTAADKNRQEGEIFLAKNRLKPGIKTTASGLQYQVLTQGSGIKPRESDTVTVHYRGTLVDGTEFDSSYNRREPATFAVNAVIPGWVEALQLMSEGSKWMLFIPSDLAYGPGGTGGTIGPNATLIFEVELLKVN